MTWHLSILLCESHNKIFVRMIKFAVMDPWNLRVYRTRPTEYVSELVRWDGGRSAESRLDLLLVDSVWEAVSPGVQVLGIGGVVS